jgi:hypothetical protein
MANSATGGCGQIEAVATERVHMLKAGWKPSDRDASGNPKWFLGVKHCSLTWTSIASHSETDGIANDGECSSHGRGSNPAMRFAKYGSESAEWLVRPSPYRDVPPTPESVRTVHHYDAPRCRADILRHDAGVICLVSGLVGSDSKDGMCNTVHTQKE